MFYRQAITSRKYRVIIVSPKILMQQDGIQGFGKLWKKPEFTNRILYFVFDEGHCIGKWSTFSREYLTIGILRYLIPNRIPFYVASATLLSPVLLHVSDILQLRPNEMEYVLRAQFSILLTLFRILPSSCLKSMKKGSWLPQICSWFSLIVKSDRISLNCSAHKSRTWAT